MKRKLVRFIFFFAYFFITDYLFGLSGNLWKMLFMSTGMALFCALMYGPFARFITWSVKKIVGPKPQ